MLSHFAGSPCRRDKKKKKIESLGATGHGDRFCGQFVRSVSVSSRKIIHLSDERGTRRARLLNLIALVSEVYLHYTAVMCCNHSE